jgi:hypothetical protein
VKAKASAKYPSGKALVFAVVVGDGGVVCVVVVITCSSFLNKLFL